VLRVSDLRILLVAAQLEGTSADGLLVDLGGFAFGEQLGSELFRKATPSCLANSECIIKF
jgi:hypothetical protein